MHYAGLYGTTKLLYENNFLRAKCLCVIQGGNNTNIGYVTKSL